jgi:DNA-binding phage protein
MSGHKTIKASDIKPLKVKTIKLSSFDDYKSSLDLNDRKKVVKLLVDMFKDGDHDAFMELAELYIDHVGKRKMSKLADIPEKTIYNFKDKKHKTSSENIFKIMKAISH